jgi:hypothetical protein
MSGEAGQIDRGGTDTIGDSRLLFADDIVSRFFIQASGGEEALATVHPGVEAGITAFMRFTNAALDKWFFKLNSEAPSSSTSEKARFHGHRSTANPKARSRVVALMRRRHVVAPGLEPFTPWRRRRADLLGVIRVVERRSRSEGW